MIIKLREVRLNRGLTLEELAEISGVSTSHISEIERSEKSPTIRVICRLAKALKVEPEELYSCDDVE